MSAESKYKEELSRLALATHGRNPMLVKIALLGLTADNTPQKIYDDIMANCGQPRLGDREVTKAIKRAEERRSISDGVKPSRSQILIAKASESANTATEEERAFVKGVVDSCSDSSSARLMELSPVPVAGLSRKEQAQLFCVTVFPDYRYACFTATEETIYQKRTANTVVWPEVLFKEVSHGRIPQFCIANQFTGRPDRPPIQRGDFEFEDDPAASYANTNTLATRRLTLLEFDNMPLDEQVRFWTAMIESGRCPGLRTLVYSGGKSIHALVRIGCEELTPTADWPEDEINYEWPRAAFKEDADMAWKRARDKIARYMEQSAEERHRSDRACKDPTRLTRFAGALRRGKDGKTVVQRLLWCSGPCVDDFDFSHAINGYGKNGEYDED